MDTSIATPAGADAPIETVSVERVAAEAGDVGKFMEADRAARAGKPPERITRPVVKDAGGKTAAPVAGKGGEAAKGPSEADRAADERLTARIREAVDTSTASLKAENEALRKRLDTAPAPPAADKTTEPSPGAVNAADVKRILALPGAPDAKDFENTTDLTAAQSAFITETRASERAKAEHDQTTHFERAKASIERVKTFHGRINSYKEKNPEFATQLTPEVRALHGWARLQEVNATRTARGEVALPATVDHAIAEELYDSAAPAEMAVHLSTHPEDLAALRAARTPPDLLRVFARIETKVLGPASADADPSQPEPTDAELRATADRAVDRSVSSAAPPAPKVGKAGSHVDPLKKAIADGNVGMFLQLDREERAEKAGLHARR